MKKTTTLLLSFLLIIPCLFGIAGCKKKNNPPPTPPEPTPVEITMEEFVKTTNIAIDNFYNKERFEDWENRRFEKVKTVTTTSYSEYTYKKQAADEDTVTEILPMIDDVKCKQTFVRVGKGFDTKILIKKDQTETNKFFNVEQDKTITEKVTVTHKVEQYILGKIANEENQTTIYRVAYTCEYFNEDGTKKETGNTYKYYDYTESNFKTLLESVVNNVNGIFAGNDIDYSLEFIASAQPFSKTTKFNDTFTHLLSVYPTITVSSSVKTVLEGEVVREITNNIFTKFKLESKTTKTNYKTENVTENYECYEMSYIYENVSLDDKVPTDEDGYTTNNNKYQYYTITSLLN